jgi:hypothetical protein
MANIQRNFIAGRMNKSLDERLVPNGEYIDALNVRLGSTEASEIGSVENSKGNTKMTSLQYEQTNSVTGAVLLSNQARCIGAYEDGQNNRIYWFVHDPAFSVGNTGKIDMIVSFNPTTQNLTYHIISIDDGFGGNTTLNFNPKHLVTGVNLVDDLLFFTDNINPPRYINVTQNYPNPLFDIDQTTAEEFMVIKKPPVTAPVLTLKQQINNLDDFLETRFICFAYRYQYANGEYSATSQWSEPAFDPNNYNYSYATNLNEGMVNTVTGVDVQFNSGSALVKNIEILYKEITDGTVKIVDKLSKDLQGFADNTQYSFTFDNSKIFTVLPSTELLRLYDNVPIKALGQTLMGNRLVYGNYIEGYDLKDIFNNPVKLEFITNLVENQIQNFSLTTSLEAGSYTFGSVQTIPNSIAKVDFSSVDTFTQLKAGTSFVIYFTFEHSKYDPTASQPTTTTENVDVQFAYVLPQDYTSIYDLVAAADFQEAIGTVSNIKPVYDAVNPTSCSGYTLTDFVNCFIPTTQTTSTGTVTKFSSGITAAGEPVKIVDNTPATTSIKLQLPAMRYVTDPASPSGGWYEYYKYISLTAQFTTVSNPKSLHSNRGYEVGVVYMDEFLRSSTALVSPNNTIQIPCSNSRSQNQIQVSIPWAQRAPYWAKYYKFVLKPDQSTYETIYSEIFFKDPQSNSYFFLLEGENAAKVEAGQRLIVKRDSGGAVEQCVEAVVTDKQVQSSNFLKIRNPFDTTTYSTEPPEDPFAVGYYINLPAGPYMEMVPSGFNITETTSVGGSAVANTPVTSTFPIRVKSKGFPVGRALVNVKNLDPNASPTAQYTDYTIPVNSQINITIEQRREGLRGGFLGGCEYRYNTYESPDLIASTDYANFQAWFEGDNIGDLITQTSRVDNGDGSQTTNTYISGTPIDGTSTGLNVSEPPETINSTDQNPFIPVALGTNSYQFFNANDGSKWLLATGTQSCKAAANVFGGNVGGRASSVYMKITVQRADQGGVVVFETIPSDASPDIWYENNVNFEVNANGEHQGSYGWQNVQTKTSAVSDTGFFNCYSFGNGVESYTVRDSVKGEALALGNRVTTTSGQDYKEAHRFADLTYSGVFNDESNVNKLNEFNLGLANFKPLEDSFGSIQKLHARKTDILTLQEDKISYVLAGKDLLTDAGGSGNLTSVPEVLGQQISRIEEYGISRNPESFAVFGADKFFTDEQRGAVIQLKGGAYNQESLTVISELGMRSWFRDLFHNNFDAQKLGGFDPYMNEYVLSANSITLPFVGNCDLCGSSRDIAIPVGETISYCVDVTQEVGTVEIEYVIPSGGNNNVITEANTPNPSAGLVNVITETNSTASSGNEIVVEDSTSNNTYTITALYNGTTTSVTTSINGILTVAKNSVYAENLTVEVSSNSITEDTIEITVNCPTPDDITIIQVGLGSNADKGKFIHNEYRWQDGLFNSPLHSELMEFKSGKENPLVSQYLSLTGSQGAGVIPDDDAKVTIISNKINFDDYDFEPNTNNFRFLRSATVYGNITSDIISLLAASTNVTPLQNNAPEFSATFTMPSGATNDNLYLIYDYRDSTAVQLCYSTVDLNDVCCVGCNVEPTPVPTPEPTPTPIGCISYTLASPSTCTSYDVKANADSIRIDFTNCDGDADFVANVPSGDSVDVCSTTIPTTTPGTGTVTAGVSCGGTANTFTWLACNGVQLEETVGGGDSSVVCASNIPVRSVGTNGTVTAGAACEEKYYAAIQCGSSGTRVFLSGSASLGVFSLGNVVYYDEINLSGSNIPIRKCATIEKINWGNGNGGEIVGQASSCKDATNCPSDLTDNPVWMFNTNQDGGYDTPANLTCNNTVFCAAPAFTSITTTANLFANNTLFFSDRDFNLPFNGNNKYYGFVAPPAGSKYAIQDFMEGWVQIGSDGRVISFFTC